VESATSARRIRILCVEDHRIVREGIVLILRGQADFDVVGTAATGREAIAQFRLHRPDVTLMDLQLPILSGLETTRMIRAEDPSARIIVLTVYRGEEDIYRAIQAGAAAYLLKDTVSDELVRVIREVVAGTTTFPDDIARQLANRAANEPLTSREIAVIELIAQGLRNRDIGRELGISETTVEVHVKNVLEKLRVDSRTGAVMMAIRKGVLHVPE